MDPLIEQHRANPDVYKSCRFNSFDREFPAVWSEFISRSATTFDQTLPWFLEFERQLVASNERVLIVGVEDSSGIPVALIALRQSRIPIVGAFPVDGISALSNYYTAYFAPLVTSGCEVACGRLLAEEIARSGRGRAVIDLNPVGETIALREMQGAWSRAGYNVERYFRFGNWFLEVNGRSSDDYFASLPGRVKSTLKRKGAKLRARSDATIVVVTEPSDVDRAMDAYEAVYRSSWKNDEPHARFIRAIAAEFAARGWLRLGIVWIGGRPAAAQLWFVYRGTASIFKLAYDEEFTDLSVGSLLTKALMQHVIDVDKVSIVDYLCGDDDYKRDWMSERRERMGMRAVRRHSLPGYVNSAAKALKALRRV